MPKVSVNKRQDESEIEDGVEMCNALFLSEQNRTDK